ncbi:hypothetical protein BDE02_05G170700 [Populus trichocarpa]|nr:hypothetical protein BDE02_05G170700 [Populus trichocarpa]
MFSQRIVPLSYRLHGRVNPRRPLYEKILANISKRFVFFYLKYFSFLVLLRGSEGFLMPAFALVTCPYSYHEGVNVVPFSVNT